VVIRLRTPATQNHMAFGIALSNKNGRLTVFRMAQKRMRMRGRTDCFDRNPNIARGAVFKPYRARESRDQLPMDLTFRCTRTDRTPTHEVRDILRNDHVEKFSAGRDFHLCQIEQKMTCYAQTIIDLEGLIQMRIIDQPLPTNCSAGFFEIDAHYDAKILRMPANFFL